MGIGLGIVLVLVGAVLLAVTVDIPYVSDDTLGIIFIAVGALAIILAFLLQRQRANTSHTTRVEERRLD